MTERGYVLKCKGKYAQVRIERNSACGQCGKCGMSEHQKHVDFYVENTLNAQVNDWVDIDIPEANSAKLAFVAYILPIIPALILMFVSIALKWKEWLSIALFFVGLAVGFAVVALIDKLHKRKWANTPTLKSFVSVTSERNTDNESVKESDKNKTEGEQENE